MTSNAEEQANSPAAAESDQTRPRSATQAPCRARQAKVGKESHGLVGAFCPWFPERNCCQVYGSRSRVRQQRGQGAPLLSQRLNFHDAYPNSAAGDFTSPAFSSSVSFRDELQIHSDLSSPEACNFGGRGKGSEHLCPPGHDGMQERPPNSVWSHLLRVKSTLASFATVTGLERVL